MKAVVIHAPRDLRVEDRAEPPAPGPGQVLLAPVRGGICGSDLHYFNHGGFGAVRLREPMILGHEVAARVIATGEGVQGLTPGQLVAVSPSRPCGGCRFCLEGLPNHCLNMRFYGSAMPFPHEQGAFRTALLAEAAQCVDAGDLSPDAAAMAEPLAVVLHATVLAGGLVGRRVLVTGCGPIGLLAVMAARVAGAEEVTAVDIAPLPLALAGVAGADRIIDSAADPGALAAFAAGKGTFDVLYECSGAQAALVAGLAALRPRGTVLQLGLGGDMTLPMQMVTAREIAIRGSFRFHAEFATAVSLLRSRRIDVAPLLTHVVPVAEAEAGFLLANDRSRAMKVQIAFDA